ncbi:Bromodomain and PHD finger-containing protein 1 [Haplosporangium gracile]|nr:Bromodomain and PHD finger-containing protein 1 [Haplosporangium gracile]
MGAARSPPLPDLDPPHSSDTQTLRPSAKRKPSSSSRTAAAEEDYHNSNNSSYDYDASSSRDRKKKKKNKKERRSDFYDYENSNHDLDHDRYQDYDQDEVASPPLPPPSSSSSSSRPVIKLPPLKISLKLSSIAPPSSSVSSHKSNSSSKKKRRSSEQISIVSDDEDDNNNNDYDNDEQEVNHSYRRRQSSVDLDEDQDLDTPQMSSHKKKKKHKHKHRHRHRKHEDQDAAGSYQQQQQQQNYELEPTEEVDRDEMVDEDLDGHDSPRITMRPGKEKRKKSRRSSSHRSHPSHLSDEAEQHYLQPTPPSPQQSKVRSRSRSVGQSNGDVSVSIKQEEAPVQPTYQEPMSAHPHSQLGMKKPRSSLQRIVMQETGVSQDEDEDVDDPLAGELDEPEDDDDDEDEDDEEEGDESDSGELTSPILDPGTNAQFGSKTIRAGQMGSKTLPPSASASKPKKARKPSVAKEAKEAKEGKETAESMPREGSVPASIRGGRKGKGSKRHLTPKTTTPAIPKKKELSVVCHKLLDNFIKRDSYVLFSQPVDPTVVLDYATIIKNPMDFATMRSKVERNFYPTIDEFLSDFQLVCDNARLYNAKETLYWRQADKLWDWGTRAIERERKTILNRDEEVLRTVKDEETLDIGGMGDYSGNSGGGGTANELQSRGSFMSVEPAVDSPMSIADSGRSHTPQQYRKTKKIKHRRDGTIAFSYATDGSIDPASHPDPWSLIPVESEFGSPPTLRPLLDANTSYNGQYLDDYPYWKPPTAGSRPASYLDYGPYAIMDKSSAETDGSSSISLPVFTGMVFGDDTGEAYVRSLAMFMEGVVDDKEVSQMKESDAAGLLQVKEHIRKKVEKLTRGASTIADKVAAIVLEEKTGQPSDVDTRISKALWQQNFDTEMGDATGIASTIGLLEKKVGANKDIPTDDSQDMQTDQPTEPEDAVMEDAIVPSERGETEVTAAAIITDVEFKDAEVKNEEKDGLQQPVRDEKNEKKPDVLMTSSQTETEMIDIRQVVRDIKAWPRAQKVKADYETWRQLKIELDSLLPSAPVDEKVKIEWGQSWTGGDSEESKKWVRESLEKNSADMRKVVEWVAAKAAEGQAAKATTEATAESTTAEDKGKAVKDKDVVMVTLSDEDKALVQRLTKTIRERLVEMAKYVPLSEVNPEKLPPPILPPVPTPAPATPTSAAAVPVAVTPTAPAPVAAPAASVTPAVTTSAAVSPAPVANTSLAFPESSSVVATPITSQATPAVPIALTAPTALITPSGVATPAATAAATLSAPPPPPTPPTPSTTTAAAIETTEAPKPAPAPAPTPTPVLASVITPALTFPMLTEAKATSDSAATVTATATSESTPVAPPNTSTTTETATVPPSTTLSAPLADSTISTPAPGPEALSEPNAVMAAPAVAASSDREGSASSLSSPGSSP